MKVTILTSSYPRFPGDGTAPFIKSIAESLAALGHQVEVLAPYDVACIPTKPNKIKVNRFKYIWPNSLHIMGHARSLKSDVGLHPLTFFLLPFFLFFGIIRLIQVTRRQQSDVIHINWVLPNGPIGLVVSLIQKTPYIVSMHGSDGYIAKKNFVFKFVAKLVFKNAKAVTACSKELLQTALDLGADPSHAHLLAWGADPEIFKPKQTIFSTENPRNTIIVSSLGRMVYKKGFDVLIEAWKTVSAKEKNCQLIFGGDGPLLEELKEKVQAGKMQDCVTFKGRIPWEEVPHFLSSSDIFVLPSILDQHGNLDGLPTVLLEAMACGNAVIASDIGGVSLVVEDQQNGILIPPRDVELLTQALLLLIKNPQCREDFGEKARNSIIKSYNWKNVAIFLSKILGESLE